MPQAVDGCPPYRFIEKALWDSAWFSREIATQFPSKTTLNPREPLKKVAAGGVFGL
jgi:hypothetical protein